MKKFLPFILILFILVGLFSPIGQVYASQANPKEICNADLSNTPCTPEFCFTSEGAIYRSGISKANCPTTGGYNWGTREQYGRGTEARTAATDIVPGDTPASGESEFEKNSGSCTTLVAGNVEDCIVKLIYYIFYVIPAFLLSLAGKFFNVIISLTLSSLLYTSSPFISEAWGIVRDLSNLFFILILLYIAIRTILGIGGSDVKKMIVQVIIMALLINFSMFFSKIIIDSANILALVFYNKINVETTVNGQRRDNLPTINQSKTGIEEKDVAGGILSAFDPTKLLSAEFFKKAKEKTQAVGMGVIGTAAYVAGGAYLGTFIPVPILGTVIGAAGGYVTSQVVGLFISTDKVPPGLMIGIILTAGMMMLFAAYAFFIAGLAFISRLIELWVLIIFSPFAFMSSTIPLFQKIEGIGWDEWIKRILKLSFMAPIFMFFLYLIFKLVSLDIFKSLADRSFPDQGTLEALVLMIIPAMVILILLHKSTEYAKKVSGELGGMVIKGASVALGIAGGLAIGGIAQGLQATAGRAGNLLASSARLKEMEGREGPGVRNAFARFAGGRLRTIGNVAADSNFDARKGAVGAVLGAAEGVTGLQFGKASKLLTGKDSYRQDRKKRDEQRRKRAEELKVGPDEALTQNLRKVEGAHQDLLVDQITDEDGHKHGNAEYIELLDTRITAQRARANNYSARSRENPTGINSATGNTYKKDAQIAQDIAADSEGERKAIKDAGVFISSTGKILDYSQNTTTKQVTEETRNNVTSLAANTKSQVDTALKNIEKEEAENAEAIKGATEVLSEAEKARNTATQKGDTEAIARTTKALRDATANLEKIKTDGTESIATAKSAHEKAIERAAKATEALKKVEDNVAKNGVGGRSINDLEDKDIPHAHHAVERSTRKRQRGYAEGLESSNRFWSGGQYNPTNIGRAEVNETVHNIRMNAKLDSGHGGKGGGH